MIKNKWHKTFKNVSLILAALTFVCISSSCIITAEPGDTGDDDKTEQTEAEDTSSTTKTDTDSETKQDSDSEDKTETSDSTTDKTETSDSTTGKTETTTTTPSSNPESNDNNNTPVISSGSTSTSTDTNVTISGEPVLYIDLTNAKWSADNSTFTKIKKAKAYPFAEVSGFESVTVEFKKDSEDSKTSYMVIDAESASKTISYNFTGTLSNADGESCGVKIKTNSAVSTAAKVYLNGVEIDSINYPCFAITGGGSATVYAYGTNIFKDGRSYGTGYGEEYSTTSGATYTDDDGVSQTCTVSKTVVADGSDSKGALYCKGNLVLDGTGSLSVTTEYKNCIAAGKGDDNTSTLTVNNGTYILTSKGKSGFAAKDVTINDGNFSFKGTGTVSTSDLHKTHCITCDGNIVIKGGEFNISAYNGKGFTADSVTISGGTIVMDVSGASGYTSENNKTGSYYDADGVLNSNASIVFSAEGIEGASDVTISGGTVKVTAEDDAINMNTSGKYVTISGGSVYLYSSRGDGVDSNGNIKISGGVIVTCAPTGSEDGLDCGDNNASITITGGTVASCSGSSNATSPSISGQKGFLLGSNGGMGRSVVINSEIYAAGGGAGGAGGAMGGNNMPGSNNAGGAMGGASSSTTSVAAGTIIVILDSDDNVVYAFTVPSVSSSSSSYSNLIMTSPKLESSGTYTVYTGAAITGGTAFNGLYTTLPTVSSSGTSVSATSL